MLNTSSITSAESLLFAMDFSNQMETDETIAASNSNGTTTVTASNSAGTDVTATVIEDGSISINGQKVQARLENCTADETYTLNFFAATSSGNFLEARATITASS